MLHETEDAGEEVFTPGGYWVYSCRECGGALKVDDLDPEPYHEATGDETCAGPPISRDASERLLECTPGPWR